MRRQEAELDHARRGLAEVYDNVTPAPITRNDPLKAPCPHCLLPGPSQVGPAYISRGGLGSIWRGLLEMQHGRNFLTKFCCYNLPTCW
jgi:hypothetical protein